MQQLADRLVIHIPQYPDLRAVGIVLALCLVAWGAALLAGRRIGPRLADFWSKVAGGRAEGIILIDGERLTSLMLEHEVGVRVTRQVCIRRLDEDFFADD